MIKWVQFPPTSLTMIKLCLLVRLVEEWSRNLYADGPIPSIDSNNNGIYYETERYCYITIDEKEVKRMLYIGEVKLQYLLMKEEDIAGADDMALLRVGVVRAKAFNPIRKKHNFVQVDENTYSLEISNIDAKDL